MQIKDVAERAAARARLRNAAVPREEARQEVLIALWELYRRRGWAFSVEADVDDAKALAVHKVASWAVVNVYRNNRRHQTAPIGLEAGSISAGRPEDLPLFALLWQELTERVAADLDPADRLVFVEMLRGAPTLRTGAQAHHAGVSKKTIQRARRRIERAVLTAIAK